MTAFRRIRFAFYLALLLISLGADPLLCAGIAAAYVAGVTYAAGDAWLTERER